MCESFVPEVLQVFSDDDIHARLEGRCENVGVLLVRQRIAGRQLFFELVVHRTSSDPPGMKPLQLARPSQDRLLVSL
jgi:hypothetical protein